MPKLNQNGFALASSIFVLTLVLLMGTLLIDSHQADGRSTFKHEKTTEVYYVAKSAADVVIASLTSQRAANDAFYKSTYNMPVGDSMSSPSTSIAGGTATVTITRVSETSFRIISVGQKGGETHTVSANLNYRKYKLFDSALYAEDSYDIHDSKIWGDVGSGGTIDASDGRIYDGTQYPDEVLVSNNDDHVFEDMDLELDPVLDSDFPALPYYGEWRQNYSYLNYEGHFSDFTAKGSLTIDTTWLSPGADSFDIVIDGNADFQANIRIDGNLPVNFYIKGDLTIEQSHFRVTGPEQLRFFVQSGDVRIARLDELKMYLYAPNSEVTISPRTNNGNGSKTIVEGAIVAKTLDIESTMRMRYVYSDLLGTMAPGITAPPGGVFSVDNWE